MWTKEQGQGKLSRLARGTISREQTSHESDVDLVHNVLVASPSKNPAVDPAGTVVPSSQDCSKRSGAVRLQEVGRRRSDPTVADMRKDSKSWGHLYASGDTWHM